MANTGKFEVIGLGGIGSTEKWGAVREDYSEGGDASNFLPTGAPGLPQQEMTQ